MRFVSSASRGETEGRVDPTGSASSQLKRSGSRKTHQVHQPADAHTHTHTTLPFDNRVMIKGDVADEGNVSDLPLSILLFLFLTA